MGRDAAYGRRRGGIRWNAHCIASRLLGAADQAERVELADFWLTNRAAMSNHVEDVLARDNYPNPPDFISGPDGYYSDIVENESETCEMRIKAAHELGTVAGITAA